MIQLDREEEARLRQIFRELYQREGSYGLEQHRRLLQELYNQAREENRDIPLMDQLQGELEILDEEMTCLVGQPLKR
ncbi:MAG: hypothetical protein HY335_05320 [Deinococcus sp.]|nr:hypothetical protein [Deinococcus sp.]